MISVPFYHVAGYLIVRFIAEKIMFVAGYDPMFLVIAGFGVIGCLIVWRTVR